MLLSALAHRVRDDDGQAGARMWLLALVDERPDAARDAGVDADVASLAAAAREGIRAGQPGAPLTAEQIETRASRRAAALNHSVIAPADLAFAILVAQETPTATVSEAVDPAFAPAAPVADGPTDGAGPAAPSVPRVIRVFVSSTFRDMQVERDELVKRTFPQLRRLCDERGVIWGEVDLRWGITDEQSAEGMVLPICLAEIDRSRPYFIGLLGEYYGSLPDEVDQGLLEREPWLTEHLDRSNTELEIVHGVLRDPAMAEHAFFYLRDPAYIDTLPGGEREAWREVSAERVDKLTALKERIRQSGFPVREDYRDPRALGELVLQDFTALIDRLFPEDSIPDPLDREAAQHEAFARSRAGTYIGRQAYFDRLDALTDGGGPPLVVLGESGAGKSALLANWALERRVAHPDEFVLLHFIGGTSRGSDWAAMLRRIIGELDRRFDIDEAIPDRADALRIAFARALDKAAARGRVVLILDALDQLEDREGALDLVWLPPEMPLNVALVVSTLPGRPLDELLQRGWPALRVEALEPDERTRLLEGILAGYARRLSTTRVARIASARQAANPLFLRALLEELRVFGVHERLDDRIDHYLVAETVDDLYAGILERYEADYERDRPGLVRDAMTLIWAGRRGLSETELLDLLGGGDRPLPSAIWSPLHLAAEQSLVERSGLITFSHDYFRQAVQHRYLPSAEEQRAAHFRLADYFDRMRLSTRGVEELPWQLAEAEAWRPLYRLLADPGFFRRTWDADEFEVRAHWARLESRTSLRAVDAYRPVLDAPHAHEPGTVWRLGRLLLALGYGRDAQSVHTYLADYSRRTGDLRGLGAALEIQAVILRDRGELDEAMILLREAERTCRQLGDEAGLATNLTERGVILRMHGDLDGAMVLYRESEGICRERGDWTGLSSSLGYQAQIHHDRGDLEGALSLYRACERLLREVGDRGALEAPIGNQGLILHKLGDLEGAMARYTEQERLCREAGYRQGLATAIGNQAVILRDRGDLDGAMTRLREQERLSRELEDQDALQASLGNQAVILRDRGDLDGAMALLGEKERICRGLDYRVGLANTLGNQAVILRDRGDLDGAMARFGEQSRICREIGDRRGVHEAVSGRLRILQERRDLDGALALLEEAERTCRELSDRAGLAEWLAHRAAVLGGTGRVGEALTLAEEARRLAEEESLPTLVGQVGSMLDHLRGRR
jgi:tetratricopeptide (TPR) repeat protein